MDLGNISTDHSVALTLLQKELPKYTLIELYELAANSRIIKAAIDGIANQYLNKMDGDA